jgi:hypothetical protein
MLGIACLGVLLSGCIDEDHHLHVGRLGANGGIPLPTASMLRAQPEPDCTRTSDRSASSSPTGDDTSDRQRARIRQLEFERQCYRQYEIQARHRLSQLQVAVLRTKKAVERRQRSTH